MNKLFCIVVTLAAVGLSSCRDEKYGCTDTFATNYDASATMADNCTCRYDGINTACGVTNPTSISIAPVQQQTDVWCWLACGEMIFRHYGLPNVNGAGDYQCGIIGVLGYSQGGACDACNVNCGNCVRPAGSAAMISYMLETYPKVACRQLYQSNQTLHSVFLSSALAADSVTNELNNNRPIMAGINPSGFALPGNSQHVAVIKGFYYVNTTLWLKVNDPYPYWTTGNDPYVNAGAINNFDLSYDIKYTDFVNGLLWNTTWTHIGW